MAVVDSKQHGAESDSLEKGNVQEMPGFHGENSLQSVDSGLTPAGVPHEDDPLHWPRLYKTYVVGLVSLLGFAGQMSSSMINPAYILLAKDLDVTVTKASYLTTVYILFSGTTPMFLVPYANVYGRRNLYLLFTLIAAIANVGSAVAKSYGGVLVGRLFNGVGSSVPLGFGAATICDLFQQGERGFYMGIYTLSVTNGPHISPIVGGYIAKNLGWRWCLWIPAILQGGLWVLVIFTLPETLFSRENASTLVKRSYMEKLFFFGKVLDRPIHRRDFGTPYRMIKYAAVTLPCIYFMTANTYGSALFAVTGAKIAAATYKFNVAQTGLFIGVPLSVGCMIGEATTGWISDIIINAYAKRHNGYRKPEARLFLIPLCTLLCIGTATYGFCIQHHKHWIESAICMGVAGLGCQVGATVVYTYCTDSYKPQSGEIGAVINLFKSIYAFNIGFYALPLMADIGFDRGFGLLAALNFVALLPLVFLIYKGKSIREKQGVPKEHQDL